MKRLIAVLMLVAAGCASAPPCRNSEKASVTNSLYFGTAMLDGGEVTVEQWQGFLAEVITPRFPAGLTSWATAGQWQDNSGRLWKERGYVLQVVDPESEQTEKAIGEIITIYKQRFHQEAVLRVRTPACVSFR